MIRQSDAHRFSSRSLRRAAVAGLALLVAGIALPAGAKTPAKDADKHTTKHTTHKAEPRKTSSAAHTSSGLPGCYSRTESAAEQTIRMHTEMMVVGLTCRSVMPDKKPFDLYQDFTVKNRALISRSEAEIMAHFRKMGAANPTRQFDMYRTEMANEISRRAATIGTPLYCSTFVDRSKAATELTPDDIRVLTSDEKEAGLMHLSTQPLCDVNVVSRPDALVEVAQAPASRTSKPKTAGKEPAKAHAKSPVKPASKSAAKSKVVAKTAMMPDNH